MSKRRANGEGSIYRHGELWAAKISQGKDTAGKRIRVSVYGQTKQEVADKLLALRNQPERPKTEHRRQSVGQFLERWIADCVEPTCREATQVSYRGIVKNHISKRIGSLPLARLGPQAVARLYGDMTRDKASPRTVQLTHAVLRRAMTIAVQWGLIGANPCISVRRPAVPAKEMQVLDEKQVVAFLTAAADDRLHALYALAIFTGMRFGELLGLQWTDVDVKNRECPSIFVRRTLQELHGRPKLAEPKSAKSKRKIDLPRLAVAALKAHKGRTKVLSAGFVFSNRSGGPLRQNYVTRKSFKPLLKKAKLPEVRFHDLRHSAATLMLKQGVHPKIVSERLGHASIQITLDRYSHVLPSMQRDAAHKMDEMFAKLNA